MARAYSLHHHHHHHHYHHHHCYYCYYCYCSYYCYYCYCSYYCCYYYYYYCYYYYYYCCCYCCCCFCCFCCCYYYYYDCDDCNTYDDDGDADDCRLPYSSSQALFEALICFVGILFMAFLLGSATSALSNMDASSTTRRHVTVCHSTS